ncbi:hypothetical protein R3W88_034243 [Solanum pinnatisectum]|uniref:Uncharacterized protein n=1 Tax=Solanum pinnatisectum TaxID=50273 RepID=A0AAV9JYM3_9SOLN|nr:hypothetical protein R3W88_034243 [Solanum pinnatisectum]
MTCSICHVEAITREVSSKKGVESSTRQSSPSLLHHKARTSELAAEEANQREEEDQKKTSSVAPRAPPLPTAPTDFPATSSTSPTYHASSSIAGTTKRGRGRGRGNTSPEKRPKVIGMGVFKHVIFKVMNPGMPSSRIYSTGQAKVTRSSNVTGDIGYTPSNTTKLKWNKKQRKKTMGSSSSQMTLLHSQRCHGNCIDVYVFKHFKLVHTYLH